MKCVNCKNLGKLKDEDGVPYDWCEKVSDNPDVHAERKCKHYITATNADKLRAMSDEELAMFLQDIWYISGSNDTSNAWWLNWLRKEAQDG